MDATVQQHHDIDIEEIEYLRHGEAPLLARVFRPRGKGPFPAVVEAHGGAWCDGDRFNNETINRPVAEGGVVVMAIDFRAPPQATYPGSVADIHYAVRWLKAHAAEFNTRPEWVGSMGTSSGGHIAILAAMKPFDPRYSAIALEGAASGSAEIDARVPYVIALWPVICPLGRYRAGVEQAAVAAYPKRGGALEMQKRYWLTEEAMAEGSPLLALERGDAVEFPDILCLQNFADPLHPREHLERFVRDYARAGGDAQANFFQGESYDLVRTRPETDAATQAIRDILGFIHRQARRAGGETLPKQSD